ncbi:MAG: DNA repair protein RecN [Alphaproteobacteria bacterium]|nr:DNA repair protein RecN [Alphaproteobacteria bacterium]
MLLALSIRDVVLIERLDLALKPGLGVLTGETGAGKSILLDALGLALGARADSALVRRGAEQAVVSASFEVAPKHPALALLAEQGLDAEQPLVLRRIVGADGRSRAFVNDQPVSIGLLRQIGDTLVEIQGQSEQRGLLDPATHRALLDAFGGMTELADAVRQSWRAWRAAQEARATAAEEAQRARRDEDYLRHALGELASLDPKPGEEQELAAERTLLANAGRLAETLNGAAAEISGERGAERSLASVQRSLTRIADKAAGRLDQAIAALDRAAAETAEAAQLLQAAQRSLEVEPRRLEQVEERLYGLREVARKHSVPVDGLPELRQRIERQLAAIDDQGGSLERLATAEAAARTAYLEAATRLGDKRARAAKSLDRGVKTELAPLKLDKAEFRTTLAPLDEADWGPEGRERVAFEVATNPGQPAGPLARIASGGELARFMLALKVVLAEIAAVPTLVFDEVDAGIGGAVADAVGERLARLAKGIQVLVVTHSPQVAARGAHHWRVAKSAGAKSVATTIEALDAAARREEIARMLSGARVTDQARAAADSLLAGRPGLSRAS